MFRYSPPLWLLTPYVIWLLKVLQQLWDFWISTAFVRLILSNFYLRFFRHQAPLLLWTPYARLLLKVPQQLWDFQRPTAFVWLLWSNLYLIFFWHLPPLLIWAPSVKGLFWYWKSYNNFWTFICKNPLLGNFEKISISDSSEINPLYEYELLISCCDWKSYNNFWTFKFQQPLLDCFDKITS